MLHPGPTPFLPPTLLHDERNTWSNLERLSSISGVSRASIAAVIAQVHGPWLLHLGARERISVLETMASLYSCLGYRRKEAYILREVLGCILDLIVCGREEDNYPKSSTTPFSAGFGLGTDGLNSATSIGRGLVGIRFSESTEGNESILQLLKYVCKVLGIDLDAVTMVDINDKSTSPPPDGKGYDDDLVEGYKETHGWPELQVGVVREAVAVAEALPGEICSAFDSNPWLKSHRLWRRCTICLVILEEFADGACPRRSVPLVHHGFSRAYDGTSTWRYQIGGILVREACC